MIRTLHAIPRRCLYRFASFALVFLLLPAGLRAQTESPAPRTALRDSVAMRTTIYFSLNNGDWIEQSEYKKVGRMLRWALSDTIPPITITGWADESGTAVFNEQLSLHRARTVRNYLVKKGIAPERITFEGCEIGRAHV